jgi:acetyl esterase
MPDEPMTLEPELQAFIDQSEVFMPPDYIAAPIEEQRRMYDRLCSAFDGGRPPGVAVGDLTIPGPAGDIPARLYRPEGPEPQACLVFMHGGSFYLGGLDSHDSIVADLAERAGATVVAVDYRLAPEHRFPAALDDSLAAFRWVAERTSELGVDPARIGVGGDSAGGNLAAALCLANRDAKGPAIRAQILIYPALAAETEESDDTPLLSKEEISLARRTYLGGDGTTDDPLAAPLLAGNLSGLPAAAVLAAGLDPLAADARAYEARLTEAGGAAELEVADGLVHGFLRARHMSSAAGRAFDWLCTRTRNLLAS